MGRPRHPTGPLGRKQVLERPRRILLGNERGVECRRVHKQVGCHPIAFRIAIRRRQAHRGLRQPFQHQPFAFKSGQRRRAVEDIRTSFSCSSFVQQTNRGFNGIAAQEIDLDAVFLLKRFGGRTGELSHDLGRVPNDLTFLFRRVDQCLVRSPSWANRQQTVDQQQADERQYSPNGNRPQAPLLDCAAPCVRRLAETSQCLIFIRESLMLRQ